MCKKMVQSCIVMTNGLCSETAVDQHMPGLTVGQLLQNKILYMA